MPPDVLHLINRKLSLLLDPKINGIGRDCFASIKLLKPNELNKVPTIFADYSSSVGKTINDLFAEATQATFLVLETTRTSLNDALIQKIIAILNDKIRNDIYVRKFDALTDSIGRHFGSFGVKVQIDALRLDLHRSAVVVTVENLMRCNLASFENDLQILAASKKTNNTLQLEEKLRNQRLIEGNITSTSNGKDKDKIPKSPWEAVFHMFWPPKSIFKKVILGAIVFSFVCFVIWTSLPEKTKIEIISLKSGFASLTPELIRPANGQTFDNFPRKTILEWKPLPRAVRYVVEIELQDIRTGAWHPIPWTRNRQAVEGTIATINFTGAQPGRWRVSAINDRGVKSKTSEWWEFFYTR